MALVRYNGLNIYRAEGLKFMPGINQPDDEALRRAGRNKLLVGRFERRELTFVNGQTWAEFIAGPEPKPEQSGGENPVVGAPAPQGGKPQAESELAKLNVKDATALIEQTVDGDLLAKWQGEDQRKGVQDAITKRLEALDPTKKPANVGENQ
jgi:hypothetical protein